MAAGEFANQFVIDSVAFGQALLYGEQLPDHKVRDIMMQKASLHQITMRNRIAQTGLATAPNPNPFGFKTQIALGSIRGYKIISRFARKITFAGYIGGSSC